MASKAKKPAAVAPVTSKFDGMIDNIRTVNDSMLWRNSLAKERIDKYKLNVKKVSGSEFVEYQLDVLDTTTERVPHTITVALSMADGVISGVGAVGKMSDDKSPIDARFYVLLSKNVDAAFKAANPNLEKDIENFFQELKYQTEKILELMFDEKDNPIKPQIRAKCWSAAYKTYVQQLRDQGKTLTAEMTKDLQNNPEVRALALKNWIKGAGTFFNPRQDDSSSTADGGQQAQEDPEAFMKMLLETNEEEQLNMDAFFVNQTAWFPPKGSKKKAMKAKYAAEAAKYGDTIDARQIYDILKKIGMVYNPVEVFPANGRHTIRTGLISKMEQEVIKMKNLQKQGKVVVTEEQLRKYMAEKRMELEDPFAEYVPRNSVVQVEIYPEPYVHKTQRYYGVRYRMVGKITLNKTGISSRETPMVTTEVYSGVDVETTYEDTFAVGDKFFAQFIGEEDTNGTDVRSSILNMITSCNIPEGITSFEIAIQLKMEAEEVRQYLAQLMGDGEIYSTIDEDHFQASQPSAPVKNPSPVPDSKMEAATITEEVNRAVTADLPTNNKRKMIIKPDPSKKIKL
jgi:hypothetical protein